MANRSAKLIAPKRDGQVVLSSPITPGFFVLGRDQNEAAARYLQIVKTLGPMPMSDTQLGAAEPEPKLPGRPRALYLGFAFDTNWGDRWMYQVLERRLPVRFIHPRSIEEHWNKVSPTGRYDVALLGGGTLINQQPQLFQDTLCALAAGLPAFCFGTGVGEVNRWGDHRGPWVKLLEQFQYVGVRGPLSRDVLAEAGLRNHVVTGDPCLLDDVRLSRTTRTTPPGRPLRLWLDLSFGGHEEQPSVLFRYELLRLLGKLEREKRIEMTLFTSWNAYLPWIEEQIAIAFGERRPVMVIGENNRHELGTADIGIAYRLHAAASLLLAGVPTLVVRYESKCLDFLAHLGLQDLVLDPDAGGMEKLRDVLLGDLTPWIAEQADRVPEAVGRAKEQVEERFSEFLESLRMTTGARPGE